VVQTGRSRARVSDGCVSLCLHHMAVLHVSFSAAEKQYKWLLLYATRNPPHDHVFCMCLLSHLLKQLSVSHSNCLVPHLLAIVPNKKLKDIKRKLFKYNTPASRALSVVMSSFLV
jgi:hypothetical protein